ncbi:MAG: 4Fe-4S binding protein [Candidatus Thiodiazotropha sp.]
MRLTEQSQVEGLLNRAELIVEEELCINPRGRLVSCTACRDRCPAGALSLSPEGVDVDEALCTGCNGCLPSCPAGALRSTAFIPERFLQALGERGETHLHCRASEDGGGGVVIPCHGVLDARLLAAARGEGVSELRLHGLNRCEQCRHGDARAHIRTLIDQLSKWLGDEAPSLDLDPRQAAAGGDDRRDYQDQPHMSRRTFLRFGGAEGVSRAMEWLVPGATGEEESEALPFFQTDAYPQRAAAYQQALVGRVDRVPWQEGRELPFFSRRVSDRCSACLSCGERCPTGALQGRETEQERELSFDASACTDCGLCERICPHSAIISDPLRESAAVSAGRQTLLFVQQQRCRQCGAPFLPTSEDRDICPLCDNEQEMDEAWLDMLSG